MNDKLTADVWERKYNNLLARIFRDGGQRAKKLGDAADEEAHQTVARFSPEQGCARFCFRARRTRRINVQAPE